MEYIKIKEKIRFRTDSIMTLDTGWCYAECRRAKCHSAECRGAGKTSVEDNGIYEDKSKK